MPRDAAVAAQGAEGAALPARHSVSFGWLDGRVWVRVYRSVLRARRGTHQGTIPRCDHLERR